MVDDCFINDRFSCDFYGYLYKMDKLGAKTGDVLI